MEERGVRYMYDGHKKHICWSYALARQGSIVPFIIYEEIYELTECHASASHDAYHHQDEESIHYCNHSDEILVWIRLLKL